MYKNNNSSHNKNNTLYNKSYNKPNHSGGSNPQQVYVKKK